MARHYRRKAMGIFELLLRLSFLLGFLIYFHTHNLFLSILGFSFIGIIIFTISYIRKNITRKKLLNSGMNIVDQMSGEEFEAFLLAHFENLGYKGKLTPIKNNYGADLIVNKDNFKIVVQAKRWKEKIGVSAIQEVIGAINYYKASKGMVITNSFFTSNAVNLAATSNIELWDRNKLIDVINQAQGKNLAETEVNFPFEE